MKKPLLYALAAAFAVAGVAETAPSAVAEPSAATPRTLEQLRAKVRGEAMTSLALGDVETVRHRRWHRRRYAPRRRFVPRRYTLRYIHRPGRSCRGRFIGRRCYYTPRILRPLRQR